MTLSKPSYDACVFGWNLNDEKSSKHFSDLYPRGVFEGFNLRGISRGKSANGIPENLVILTTTLRVIAKQVRHITDNPDITLLSLAGLMKPKIIGKDIPIKCPDNIINMHFLFGAGAEKDLKIALSTNGRNIEDLPPSIQQIIKKVRNLGMEIIETNPEEHDEKMAYVQGLPHRILAVLSAVGEILPPEVENPWKNNVPVSTCVDMILRNKYMQEVTESFLSHFKSNGKNISVAWKSIFTEDIMQNLEQWKTPNFRRVDKFLRENEIIIDSNEASKVFYRVFTGENPNKLTKIIMKARKIKDK
ncbi:prephenate dehydrogenase/arogenate dehydrogenase family protein [Candidatus Gracilibacteria bacterium]|nr:prephenate dehydrogenase/arogenate dehydrogenase family protein [Candidatus Gracilibacteria bacterium]NUJ99489.1 prephenate dehydrogenase/arogenate dehydrogenase family protein [Candidatus Gracilibacteria bacterium]